MSSPTLDLVSSPASSGVALEPGPAAGPTGRTASHLRRPVDRWLHRALVANLVLEVLIVATGGLVRVTGSGLGCPTWPQCVPGSFVPVRHQEQGFHKYVEFGNRLLTYAVSIAAILVILAMWRWARQRRALRLLAFLPLIGVALQAVVGGITVLSGLNPWVVLLHFLASMVLVALSAYLLVRFGEGDGQGTWLVRREIRLLARGTAALTAVILLLGTVVTGSGPHSGDAAHPARLGFNPRDVAFLHADAVMLYLGLLVAMVVALRVSRAPLGAIRAWTWVLGVALAQGVVGYVQYFTGLPDLMVVLHLLGAAVLVLATVVAMLALRRRA